MVTDGVTAPVVDEVAEIIAASQRMAKRLGVEFVVDPAKVEQFIRGSISHPINPTRISPSEVPGLEMPLYASPHMGEALAWSMDEIDILSNKMSGFAYPQGMVPARRRDQLDNYRKAVDARRSALQDRDGEDGR
jgi:hypothetical protein